MNLRSLYGTLQNIFTQPRKVFALALVLGIFCSASYALFLSDIYRDTAHVYAVFARAFGNGNFSEAIATKVPMLNIVLSAVLVFFGVEAAQALTIVAGIFYLAACFPLRSLLERYVSPLAAAWGCVLYISAPKMIRFACAPLLESSRIFFLLTAVLYFLRNTDEPKVKNAVLFGVSAGLIAVSRGEGLVVTFVLLGAYLFYVKLFGRQVAWKKQFATWVIALFCCFVSVSPFCAMNYSKSGYFVTDMRMVEVVEKLTGSSKPLSLTAPRWSRKPVSEHDARVWRIKHGFASLIRGGYELFWVFAILGGVLIIRQKRWKADYWVFVGIAFAQTAVYFAVVSAYRYYLYLIPLFMMFTLTGIDFLRRLIVKYVPGKYHFLLVLLCAAGVAGQIANGVERAFSSKGKDFQAAGKWVEDYGRKHFPNRRLIVFAPKMTEVAYWSKAYHTDGYEMPEHDPEKFRDFDLAIVHRKYSFGMEKRTDLERIPDTPHSDNIWIFRPSDRGNK